MCVRVRVRVCVLVCVFVRVCVRSCRGDSLVCYVSVSHRYTMGRPSGSCQPSTQQPHHRWRMEAGASFKRDGAASPRYLSPRAVTHAARQQSSLTARDLSRNGRPLVHQPQSARAVVGPSHSGAAQSAEPSAPTRRIIEPAVAQSMLLEIFGNDTTFGLTDEYLALMKKDSSLQIMLPAERRKEPLPIHSVGGDSGVSIVRAPDEPRPFTAVVPVPPPRRLQSRQRPQTVPSPSPPPPPPPGSLDARLAGGGAFGSQLLDDGFALDQSWAMGRTSPFGGAPGGAPAATRHAHDAPHVYPDGHHPLSLSLAPLNDAVEAPAATPQQQPQRHRRRRRMPQHSVGALLEDVHGPLANMVELSQVLDMPPFIEQAAERFQVKHRHFTQGAGHCLYELVAHPHAIRPKSVFDSCVNDVRRNRLAPNIATEDQVAFYRSRL